MLRIDRGWSNIYQILCNINLERYIINLVISNFKLSHLDIQKSLRRSLVWRQNSFKVIWSRHCWKHSFKNKRRLWSAYPKEFYFFLKLLVSDLNPEIFFDNILLMAFIMFRKLCFICFSWLCFWIWLYFCLWILLWNNWCWVTRNFTPSWKYNGRWNTVTKYK